MEQTTKRDYVLPVSILIAAALVAGAIVYSVQKPVTPGTGTPSGNGGTVQTDVSKAGPRDVILGDANAPVTFVEYGDYQCPFCGRFFSQIEPSLRNDYIKTSKVKMIFRNFSFLGPESTAAAEAAECAKDQHQFWAYHDALYTTELQDGHENSGNLTRDLFVKLASDLKMDTAVFGKCIDNHTYAAEVTNGNQTASNSFGINSTPTSFVNGKEIQGAVPYAQVKAAIDAALQGK